MVRVTTFLLRVPVIKFRKGAGGPVSAPASPVSTPSSQPGVQSQTVAAMSSASIPDIDLPPRYRRRPPSQEEIDCINGGGIA